jgi:hypothetical protein
MNYEFFILIDNDQDILKFFPIQYSDSQNYKLDKVKEEMVITRPDDFHFDDSLFDVNSLKQFCDDDAFHAIKQLFNVKFKSNKQELNKKTLDYQ